MDTLKDQQNLNLSSKHWEKEVSKFERKQKNFRLTSTSSIISRWMYLTFTFYQTAEIFLLIKHYIAVMLQFCHFQEIEHQSLEFENFSPYRHFFFRSFPSSFHFLLVSFQFCTRLIFISAFNIEIFCLKKIYMNAGMTNLPLFIKKKKRTEIFFSTVNAGCFWSGAMWITNHKFTYQFNI